MGLPSSPAMSREYWPPLWNMRTWYTLPPDLQGFDEGGGGGVSHTCINEVQIITAHKARQRSLKQRQGFFKMYFFQSHHTVDITPRSMITPSVPKLASPLHSTSITDITYEGIYIYGSIYSHSYYTYLRVYNIYGIAHRCNESWQNITRDPGERGGSYCSLGREYEAARLALAVPQQERPVASLVEDGVGPLAGDEAVVVAHCFPATHSHRKLLHATRNAGQIATRTPDSARRPLF